MVNLTLDELRLIPRGRGIRNYRNISRERLLSALDESERNFINARIKKIGKYLNIVKCKLLRSKINEIRRNLCEIKNKRENEENLSRSEIENIKINLIELKKVSATLTSIMIMMIWNTKE